MDSMLNLIIHIAKDIENNTNNVLGETARESAVKRFAVDVVSDQYKELYQALNSNTI